MAKINDKIKQWQAEKPGVPFFSFEYFPPKTDDGVTNLYARFDRMARLDPMWIDVTWGAGGSTADKTLELCVNAIKIHGLNVMMHLTCTNMPKEKLLEALMVCKENGIRNILALRGDPPAGVNQGEWKQVEGGFAYAVDLVKFIRQEFGDFFCIAVAGYPEGHLEATSKDDDMVRLKEKCDAGADLIVTQLFYGNDLFQEWVDKCRKMGITIPILPGIMPIQSFGGFTRMTGLCKTFVPQHIHDALEPVKEDDAKVKDMGVELAVKQCKELLERGTPGLHFYTLNLETSVMRIIEDLGLLMDYTSTKPLPWQPSPGDVRKGEDVRPIFWANRPASYRRRTATWDEFPNGRFGNHASPAYAFEECFISFSKGSAKASSQLKEMWGESLSGPEDIAAVFAGYLKGNVSRLPWCQERPATETSFISKQLVKLNQSGLLTINSQPRVNANLSTDPYVGWGPAGGFVYQKAYLEFFCSEVLLGKLAEALKENKWIGYMAVNKAGKTRTNISSPSSVNAVTWGVFPGAEVKQPTVVDSKSFMAWKDEAFALWSEWTSIYDEGSASRDIVENVANSYYLVNIVDNNFVSGDLVNDLIQYCC